MWKVLHIDRNDYNFSVTYSFGTVIIDRRLDVYFVQPTRSMLTPLLLWIIFRVVKEVLADSREAQLAASLPSTTPQVKSNDPSTSASVAVGLVIAYLYKYRNDRLVNSVVDVHIEIIGADLIENFLY
jgi:hypothetical protein